MNGNFEGNIRKFVVDNVVVRGAVSRQVTANKHC